jgi:hypothetical protein
MFATFAFSSVALKGGFKSYSYYRLVEELKNIAVVTPKGYNIDSPG